MTKIAASIPRTSSSDLSSAATVLDTLLTSGCISIPDPVQEAEQCATDPNIQKNYYVNRPAEGHSILRHRVPLLFGYYDQII